MGTRVRAPASGRGRSRRGRSRCARGGRSRRRRIVRPRSRRTRRRQGSVQVRVVDAERVDPQLRRDAAEHDHRAGAQPQPIAGSRSSSKGVAAALVAIARRVVSAVTSRSRSVSRAVRSLAACFWRRVSVVVPKCSVRATTGRSRDSPATIRSRTVPPRRAAAPQAYRERRSRPPLMAAAPRGGRSPGQTGPTDQAAPPSRMRRPRAGRSRRDWRPTRRQRRPPRAWSRPGAGPP